MRVICRSAPSSTSTFYDHTHQTSVKGFPFISSLTHVVVPSRKRHRIFVPHQSKLHTVAPSPLLPPANLLVCPALLLLHYVPHFALLAHLARLRISVCWCTKPHPERPKPTATIPSLLDNHQQFERTHEVVVIN